MKLEEQKKWINIYIVDLLDILEHFKDHDNRLNKYHYHIKTDITSRSTYQNLNKRFKYYLRGLLIGYLKASKVLIPMFSESAHPVYNLFNVAEKEC
jgi:hypothetical protein|tara:strand:- start:340 stop:627 length:288 start_codon:yes stop_codon:yes gene_type:complete